MSVSIVSLSFSSARETLAIGLNAIKNGQDEFDLGNIATADSSSIAVMLAWQRAAQAISKHLRFFNAPADILSLASLYGVTDFLGLKLGTESSPN